MNISKREEKLFAFLSDHMQLTEEEKRAVLDLAMVKTYPKGATLFEEGDKTNESYLVIEGCLRTFILMDGNDITTEFYTEFDSFSPSSTVTGAPSNCYASCLETSVLLVSTPEIEEEVFEKFPAFEKLCRLFSEKLMARKQVSFDEFRRFTPEQRYLHTIESRPELVQRVPQYHLASYLGIRPESLSRIRKRLAQQ